MMDWSQIAISPNLDTNVKYVSEFIKNSIDHMLAGKFFLTAVDQLRGHYTPSDVSAPYQITLLFKLDLPYGFEHAFYRYVDIDVIMTAPRACAILESAALVRQIESMLLNHRMRPC